MPCIGARMVVVAQVQFRLGDRSLGSLDGRLRLTDANALLEFGVFQGGFCRLDSGNRHLLLGNGGIEILLGNRPVTRQWAESCHVLTRFRQRGLALSEFGQSLII